MLLPKEERIVDPAYRRSAQDHSCENCGAPNAMGAHPRTGGTGGTSAKPSDDLLIFLCDDCHLRSPDNQEHGGARWLARFFMLRVLKTNWPDVEPTQDTCLFVTRHQLYPWLRRRYRIWKAEQ